MRRVFADTSYFIAVIAPGDAMHAKAVAWGRESLRLTTSAWIMTELAAYLGDPPNRPLFTQLLTTLRASSLVDFVPASQDLFDRGTQLYADRPDKAWSLVDCISFLIMQDRSLNDALTADCHFQQAGFSPLLLGGFS